MSYKQAGVDIDAANKMKGEFVDSLRREDVSLNRANSFAAIIDAGLTKYSDPVLVFKSEEPGSKQLIAFENNRIETICADLVNHLINDSIMCGATPVSIQDVIVCGGLDPAIVKRCVAAMAQAASAQGCFLSGGETSEQPGVLDKDRYILSASVIGVIERGDIVDGSTIERGDVVLALRSTGIHTNGYSMVRHLISAYPELSDQLAGGRKFLDVILDTHACYYQCLRPLFLRKMIKGAAHITGGGIRENLNRVLNDNVDAFIRLESYRPQAVFGLIHELGQLSDDEMLRTFNLGVGVAIVVSKDDANAALTMLSEFGQEAFIIGEIRPGSARVHCEGKIQWPS